MMRSYYNLINGKMSKGVINVEFLYNKISEYVASAGRMFHCISELTIKKEELENE